VRALFAEPNPSVVKGVLAAQGWCGPALRAPLLAASASAVQAADAACALLPAMGEPNLN
jgi:4-hydroxy-tetrahydrodipicolinate synthase